MNKYAKSSGCAPAKMADGGRVGYSWDDNAMKWVRNDDAPTTKTLSDDSAAPAKADSSGIERSAKAEVTEAAPRDEADRNKQRATDAAREGAPKRKAAAKSVGGGAGSGIAAGLDKSDGGNFQSGDKDKTPVARTRDAQAIRDMEDTPIMRGVKSVSDWLSAPHGPKLGQAQGGYVNGGLVGTGTQPHKKAALLNPTNVDSVLAGGRKGYGKK